MPDGDSRRRLFTSVVTVLWRLVLVLALMFWQGGFTFYGAVVVPIGSDVLGSHQEQGWITRSVTNYLNLAGAVALALWAVDIAVVPARGVGGRKVRLALWCVLAATLGLLAWMHLRLDALLDLQSFTIRDPVGFHDLHEWYLTVSTVQWAAGIVLTTLTLWAWRGIDGRVRLPTTANGSQRP